MLSTCGVEDSLRVPWRAGRLNQSILKGIQPWIFTGRIDTEAEAPILWPPDAKSWLIGKDHDAGKDWRQKEKRATEDEMVGWHQRWTCTWVNSGSWCGMEKPDMLQSMGSWRVKHNMATDKNNLGYWWLLESLTVYSPGKVRTRKNTLW